MKTTSPAFRQSNQSNSMQSTNFDDNLLVELPLEIWNEIFVYLRGHQENLFQVASVCELFEIY